MLRGDVVVQMDGCDDFNPDDYIRIEEEEVQVISSDDESIPELEGEVFSVGNISLGSDSDEEIV